MNPRELDALVTELAQVIGGADDELRMRRGLHRLESGLRAPWSHRMSAKDARRLMEEADLELVEREHQASPPDRPVGSGGWFTATGSMEDGAACVEVRFDDSATSVRDSKNRSGPVFTFGSTGWRTFIAGVKAGHLDMRDSG